CQQHSGWPQLTF
nr:immunoglobulin light chain junction region [Macaca mulatta]MPN91370.1 immunoglobulin light chain junction region [Macaca mulatta]MPN91412.1 immunoglobulin light chain junction region [Macaca mulatta]MPN91436.1 immunoglobulin light chain junction region [Macaca mulatta]MPN91455.1 immunoglobulin light chain junction region [Macaca mulatta]